MADKKKPQKEDLDEYGFKKTYDSEGNRTTSPEEAEVKRQAILSLARQNQGPYGGRNQDTLDQAMYEASQLPPQAPPPAQLSGGVRAATGAPTPMPPAPNPLDLSNAVRQQTGQPQLPPPTGMWSGGTAGGPASMASGGKVKKFRQDLNAEVSDEDYSKHKAAMDNAKKIIAKAKASGFDQRVKQRINPVNPAMDARKQAIQKMADGGVVEDNTVIADHGKPGLGYKHTPSYHKGTSNPHISNVPNYDDGGLIGNPPPAPTPEFQQTQQEREAEAEEYTKREDERKFQSDEEEKEKAKRAALQKMSDN